MAVRTINKGNQFLTITNLTAQRLAFLNGALAPGGSGDFPAEDYINRPDAAEDLAGLIEAGKITVAYSGFAGLTLTAAQMRTLRGLEVETNGVPIVDDASRPAVADVPVGYTVFNTTDNTLNVSDGTNWIDIATALAT